MNAVARPKFTGEVAAFHARSLMELLRPCCERIAIAGSLRRQKREVGDIELLFVGQTQLRPNPEEMFSTISVDLACEAISGMEKSGVLSRRLNVNGSQTYGPKNKFMMHVPSGIPIDLFSTSLENWWVSLVIRTGSKETNLRLTNGAIKRGARLNAYGCGVTWSDGTTTPAVSEEHVFELCGIPYLKPEQR